jgi:hypothetical protein
MAEQEHMKRKGKLLTRRFIITVAYHSRLLPQMYLTPLPPLLIGEGRVRSADLHQRRGES